MCPTARSSVSRTRATMLVAVAAALALGGAACGPGEPSIDDAPVVDACALLTGADVQALLGQPVDPPQSIPGTTGACRYRVRGGRSASLVLTFRPKELPGDEHDRFDANRSFVSGAHPVDVGDDAYFGEAGFGEELHTLSGGDYLILGVPPRTSEQAAARVMRKALSRR